jgi:hypothetical protein
VVSGGLVDILHAGVVVITHAQRFREDQADRAPRARVARRARDATVGGVTEQNQGAFRIRGLPSSLRGSWSLPSPECPHSGHKNPRKDVV